MKTIQPEICEDGWYCYCPICGYYDLFPDIHDKCPKCGQLFDWGWFWEMKNKMRKK